MCGCLGEPKGGEGLWMGVPQPRGHVLLGRGGEGEQYGVGKAGGCGTGVWHCGTAEEREGLLMSHGRVVMSIGVGWGRVGCSQRVKVRCLQYRNGRWGLADLALPWLPLRVMPSGSYLYHCLQNYRKERERTLTS